MAPAPLSIRDHRLPGCWCGPSPNHGGPLAAPRFLVIHYTAGASLDGAVNWLMNPAAPGKPSAHLVVGRDGQVRQLVPFDTIAYHAGKSHWRGLDGLNAYALGIELVNAGPLTVGAATAAHEPVLIKAHKNGGPVRRWQIYPEAQLDSLERVVRALLAAYPSVTEIVGHDDIAPGRKTDPGPAFPMERFRALLPTPTAARP